MARKVRGFERVLDAPALFAIAYGEIAAPRSTSRWGSSPVGARVHARRARPSRGSCSCVVSLSYAEGTAAIPETGGAETFTRRAYNDLCRVRDRLGTVPRLPDRDRALGAVPAALRRRGARGRGPATARRGTSWSRWAAIAGSRVVRLVGAHGSTGRRWCVALLDLVVHSRSCVIGLALVFSPETLADGLSLALGQDWSTTSCSRSRSALLAYTGLETVANLAEEAREPGRTLPRSFFSAIGLVVVLTVLVAVVGVTAFPGQSGASDLGGKWLEAPLVGIVTAFEGELPSNVVEMLRITVGLSSAADPRDGDHHLHLGLRSPRALDGHARHAAARARAVRAPHPGLAGDHRRDHGDGDRHRPRRRDGGRRGALPREHLQLRRAAGLHARAAGGDPAAAARAGPPTPLPGAARRADPRRCRAARRARRGAAHGRDLRARDGHARGRALRGACLARPRPRHLRRDAHARAEGDVRGRRPPGRTSGRRVLPPHPRADEARRHRRGDGRDRGRAREGERRPRRGDHGRPGAA